MLWDHRRQAVAQTQGTGSLLKRSRFEPGHLESRGLLVYGLSCGFGMDGTKKNYVPCGTDVYILGNSLKETKILGPDRYRPVHSRDTLAFRDKKFINCLDKRNVALGWLAFKVLTIITRL